MDSNDTEDLGTLVSEDVTMIGFSEALFDIMFMGMYLAGAIACLLRLPTMFGLEFCAIFAIGLALFQRWLSFYWRVMHPRDSYQTVRTFVKEGKTTIVTE
jgi:hypothetical protein